MISDIILRSFPAMSSLKSMFEALVMRSAPGILNLIALLLLGSWLSTVDYGQFSMALAVSAFIAMVVFGPLLSATVSQYAALAAENRGRDYESSYVSLTLIIALITTLVGGLFATTGLAPIEWVVATATFGAYSAFQELLRAQLRPWAYGVASIIQSLLYLGLVVLIARRNPDPAWVLNLFSLSYAVAALVALWLLKFPPLRRPDLVLLEKSLKVGGGYIGSTLGENILYVGMRYAILIFGTPHALGVFSFSVDLAQRTVGFMVNAASFIFVPLAFHRDVQGDGESFGRTLRNGALVSTALSFATFAGILVVRALGFVTSLSGELFEPIIFAIISIAIVLNRLKKLLIDPFAMRATKPFILMVGYIVGAPPALIMGAVAYRADMPYWGAVAYLAGYLLAILVTVQALRRTIVAT
ncbi:lipopolysaccharide biosynthesis protein [Sphingopyxis fribergensis]